MAIVLALASALSFGCSDFAAGLSSRRFAAAAVTSSVLGVGTLTAALALALFPGAGVRPGPLAWGALSGVGSAGGTLALYRGLAVGRMSVVAPISAVISAVLPVGFGLLTGESLGPLAAAGIVFALPAITLVSRPADPAGPRAGATASTAGPAAGAPADTVRADPSERAAVGFAVAAGCGFALLFIAYDRAGTATGAWPVLAGQLVGCLLTAPLALRDLGAAPRPSAATLALTLGAGVLSALGNLMFLAATGHGELAIVAVVSALYPAATVLLARTLLDERFSATQALGLALSGAAIVLVSVA